MTTTGAGKLSCKYVIHAVGPIWKGGNENEEVVLARAVTNALQEANFQSVRSIAVYVQP